MKAEEKIFGGPWEGLCLIENYDGAFYGDPERDVMQPTATVSADDMAGWPSKYNAFRIHDDGTVDVVFYYSTAYTSMLRHCAWEIYRMAEGLSAWPRDKWIECPNMSLIPQNSAQQHYQIMVSEMQRFAGIDLTQFVTLDPDIHAEPKPGRTAPVGGMWYKPEKTPELLYGKEGGV